MNSLSEPELSEKIKYPTIWLKTLDILKLNSDEVFKENKKNFLFIYSKIVFFIVGKINSIFY